jgi:hypothetical protein
MELITRKCTPSALAALCLSATAATGFFVGGLTALYSPDDSEIQQAQKKIAEARSRGWLEQYLTMRRESGKANPVAHWRTRPGVRRAIWTGLVFSLLALIASRFL